MFCSQLHTGVEQTLVFIMQQSTTETPSLFSYDWEKQRCICNSIPELSACSSPKQAEPGLGKSFNDQLSTYTRVIYGI